VLKLKNNSGAKAFKHLNPLTPNDPYRGRTAPLTSKRCILYIYSTNIGTEYFKYGIYSPFFPSSKCSLFHNSNVFGSCVIHILYTGVLKLKKIRPKMLKCKFYRCERDLVDKNKNILYSSLCNKKAYNVMMWAR